MYLKDFSLAQWISLFVILAVLLENGTLDQNAIRRKFINVLSDKLWQNVVHEAVTRCHSRLLIDASLEKGRQNGCSLHPALFALCTRRYMLANCPRSARPRTDSNSCSHRLSLVRDRCDPFALVPRKPEAKVVSDSGSNNVDSKSRTVGEKAGKSKPTDQQSTSTTKLITTKKVEVKIVLQDANSAGEGGGDLNIDENPPQIEQLGNSLQTVQRQIREIETLETPEAREALADQVRRELDTIAEDVEVLGREKPEVMKVAPRLAQIRQELNSFDSVNLAQGLGDRLVLEVGLVRDQLLKVANNIQQGLSNVGESIRTDVSKVALDVASGAVGLGSAVGSGIQGAGQSIQEGVNAAQSGIQSLSLEGIGQLQKIGGDVSASVSNVKKNFDELRQESAQRLVDASSSINMQLLSGLKGLHKLRDESTDGAKMLATNIQKNLRERLDEISKQFSNLKLTGK